MVRHSSTSGFELARAPTQPVRTAAAAVALHRAVVDVLEDRRLLSFGAPDVYAVGPLPFAIASADFNGDGVDDVATTSYSGHSVSVVLGDLDGDLPAAESSPTGAFPQYLAAGKFNNDASADLVTASSAGVSVLISNGNGTFQPPQALAALPGQFPVGYSGTDALAQAPGAVAVGDLNSDGKLDLAVNGQTRFDVHYTGYYGGDYTYTVTNNHVNVLLGNGDGTFAAANTFLNNASSQSISIADVNDDDTPDVVTYGYGISLLRGNGDGTLQSAVQSGFGFSYGPAPIGDFDGEGNFDIVLANGGSVVLFAGQPDGTFQSTASVFVGTVRSVAAGDLNADGKLDVVANTSETHFTSYGNYGGYDPVTTDQTKVLLGYGDGTFAQPLTSTLRTEQPGFGSTNSAVLGDFNGDDKPDLAATEAEDGTVIVQLNGGDFVLPPAVSIGDASVTEGNTGTVNIEFTVTLSSPSASQITVQFATAPDTAGSPGDFTALTGTVTFAPNETSKKVTIAVTGDVRDEADETFTVNLSNAVGAQINDGQAVGTIVDNDPLPSITINNVSLAEKHKGLIAFTFTVSLSAASGRDVTVNFATGNGTATIANRDYNATSGSLTFAAGVTTRTITVFVVADRTREAAETFFVNLSGAVNGVITDSQGLGTILDDDTHGNKK